MIFFPDADTIEKYFVFSVLTLHFLLPVGWRRMTSEWTVESASISFLLLHMASTDLIFGGGKVLKERANTFVDS